MPPTYLLARDHLEQAASILHGSDLQTVQLRRIVERTIALMRTMERRERRQQGAMVIDLQAARLARGRDRLDQF